MLVAAGREITVGTLKRGHDLPIGVHVTDVMHRIADHGSIEPDERMRLKSIIERHRDRNRPPRLADEFRIVDVDMPIDQHGVFLIHLKPRIAFKRSIGSGMARV